MKRSFWVTSVLFFIFAQNIYPRDWNGIQPSISTRLEAEKILGKSNSTGIEFGFYEYDGSRVEIDYFRKNAKADINEDVVTTIWIYPKKKFLLKNVSENLSSFTKETGESDIPGLAFYVNGKDGFAVEVQKPRDSKEELVTAFIYSAPAK